MDKLKISTYTHLFLLSTGITFIACLYPITMFFSLIVMLVSAFVVKGKFKSIFLIYQITPLINTFWMYYAKTSGSINRYFLVYLVILFFILAYAVIHKKIKLFLGRFELFSIVFFSYLVISTLLFSEYKDYGFEKLTYLMFTCYGSLIVYVFYNSKKSMDYLLASVSIFAFIITIIAIVTPLDYHLIFGEYFEKRLTTFKLNPIWIARYLSYGLIANIYLIIKYRNKIIPIVVLSILSVFEVIYFFRADSRAPTIALLMGIMLFVFFRYRKNKIVLYSLIVSILAMSIFVYLNLQSLSSTRLTGGGTANSSSYQRIIAQYQAYELLKENYIFGGGFGSFAKFYLEYPHNIFSEITSETGLIGLVLLLTMLVTSASNALKLLKKSEDLITITMLVLLVMSFINVNFSGHVGINPYFWIFLSAVNILFLKSKEVK